MASQWPQVAARLTALLPTLPGWSGVTVVRGPAVGIDAAMFVTVGHATDGTNSQTGHYTKQQYVDGYSYSEQGSVICQLTMTRPAADTATAEATLFGLFDAFEAAIRADRRLGILSQEGTTSLTVDLASVLATGTAAYASVTFSVDYFTVT